MNVRNISHAAARLLAACAALALAGALSTVAAPAHAADDESLLTVGIERSDTNGERVYAGDRLTYTITYTNTSNRTLTVFPAAGNLDGLLPPDRPNCRWANLQAGQTQRCTTANHVVTPADVQAGGFTAHTEWNATADRDGTQVLQGGIAVDAPRVTVVDGSRPLEPDEATVPRVRADNDPVRLAHAGQYGVNCYRIPAIAQAPNGSILTAYDARPMSCQDAPQANSIVQRISRDGGKSFETRTVVAAGRPGAPKHGYSDPSYVVDEVTGDIFMFFVKSFDNGWGASTAGVDPNDRSVLHAAVTKSSDNGETWSEPWVITADITNDVAHWTSRFAASGHGIQLKYGKYAGRLIQQYTINNNGAHQAVSVYSDDHGATWHAGTPVGEHMDENKVVELSDGRVMLNSRPYGSRYRQVAISNDGGQTYSAPVDELQLPDPANNAQITRAFPKAAEGTPAARILLYSSSSATGRRDGLIRISFDDGARWSSGKVFKEGAMAYSTITALDERAGGGYGLLYEGDNNDLMYTRISLDWLDYLSADVNGSASVEEGTASVDVPLEARNFGRMDYTDMTVLPRMNGLTGWRVDPVPSFALKAGETSSPTMRVAVPADAKAGDSVRIPVLVASKGIDGMPGMVEVRVTGKSAKPDTKGKEGEQGRPVPPVRPDGRDDGTPNTRPDTRKDTGKDARKEADKQAGKDKPQDNRSARSDARQTTHAETEPAGEPTMLSMTGSTVGLIAMVSAILIGIAVVLLVGRKHAGHD